MFQLPKIDTNLEILLVLILELLILNFWQAQNRPFQSPKFHLKRRSLSWQGNILARNPKKNA